MIIIIILITVYVVFVLFYWYSIRKAYSGDLAYCNMSLWDIVFMFIPVFNIIGAIVFTSYWDMEAIVKKFFKLK